MTKFFAIVHAWYLTLDFDPRDDSQLASTDRRDRGQATTEYALVMLGAALVALLVVTWATSGGAGKIGRLFDRVIDSVLSKLK